MREISWKDRCNLRRLIREVLLRSPTQEEGKRIADIETVGQYNVFVHTIWSKQK